MNPETTSDQEMLTQMGARGRRRMEAEFSLDQWLDRWVSLVGALSEPG